MSRYLHSMAAGLLVVLIAVSLTVPGVEAKAKWEKIKIPPLGEVQLPEYERVELANGMILYLAEDHQFPLVELSATIAVGSIYEPDDKVGLADMTGTVLRTGGTENTTGDEIDALVEAKGMSIETWIGNATGGAYLSVLKEDTDLGLDLLADIFRRPAFAEQKIDLAKEEQKAAISRRNDQPMTIVRREVVKVLYGPGHPLARQPEYDTVAAVSRQDMLDFHATYFHPDRVYLVVIGDFVSQQIVTKIEAVFGDWARATTPLPPDPEIPDLPRTVNVIDKEDLTQSTVLLGHRGIRNDDPDYAAIVVGNRILGGGFGDRLFNEVRSKRGYAYSVGSMAGTGWRYPGTFMAYTMTKNETVEAATDVILAEIQKMTTEPVTAAELQQAKDGILAEIRKMTTEPVTAAELQQAKDGILAAEVFSYDTKREVLDRLVLFEMYGYPTDFLQNYQEQVQNLTADQILTAAQNKWHPDRMTILALGNPAAWDGDLSKFGPINEIDITIPDPSVALNIPAATPESLERGSALMTTAAAGAGGQDKFAGLKSYYEKSELAAKIQGMDLNFVIEKTVVYPDRMVMIQKTPFGDMTQVLDGDTGWSSSPRGTEDLGPDDRQRMQEEIASDLIRMLGHPDEFVFQALAPTEIEGVMCDPVYVTAEGIDYQIVFLDPQSGRVRMIQSQGTSPLTQAPATQKVYVDDYQELGGFTMPKTMRLMFDDELFGTIAVQQFEANPRVDEAAFKKAA